MARPIYEAKKKGISVAVWGSVDRPSISIKKRYKDAKTKEYKDTTYYYEDNLAELVSLITEVEEWLRGQRAIGTIQNVEVLGTTIAIKTNADDDVPW
jgi:hypothetical protein